MAPPTSLPTENSNNNKRKREDDDEADELAGLTGQEEDEMEQEKEELKEIMRQHDDELKDLMRQHEDELRQQTRLLRRMLLCGLVDHDTSSNSLEELERFNLSFPGYAESPEGQHLVSAAFATSHFEVDAVTCGKERLNDTGSCVLAQLYSSQAVHNEADLQMFTISMIRDAVHFVNKVVFDGEHVLIHRMESGLFTNRLDHSIVYDTRNDDAPVFCAKEKLPDNDAALETDTLFVGQGFDYVMQSSLVRGMRVFGILSTWQESRVIWSSADDKSQEAAMATGRLTKESLDQLKTPMETQTEQPACVSANRVQTRASSRKFASFERKLIMSKETYPPHDLFTATVNAIVCSLQLGFRKPESMVLPQDSIIQGNRLVMELTKDTAAWKVLRRTLKLSVPLSLSPKNPDKYYGVGLSGTGSTSKAWRAVTEDGQECVIKMYVCNYDVAGHEMIPEEKFKETARTTVQTEVTNYMEIYPELASKYVWSQELAGHECVILPYFTPIEEELRESALPEIENLLKEKFYRNGFSYQFYECHQSWQDVGRSKLEDEGGSEAAVYLFDLAHLKKVKARKKQHEKYVKDHLELLRNELRVE